jgi:hypothetical protein
VVSVTDPYGKTSNTLSKYIIRSTNTSALGGIQIGHSKLRARIQHSSSDKIIEVDANALRAISVAQVYLSIYLSKPVYNLLHDTESI